MILQDAFPEDQGWETSVLATDISMKALNRARQGIWPIKDKDEIPQRYLEKYMLRGTGAHDGQMAVHPHIRGKVWFKQLNLVDSSYEVPMGFDLILCRNVLIYFRRETKQRVVDKLLEHLGPRGFIAVGAAESLHGLGSGLRRVVPSVYRPPSPGSPPTRPRKERAAPPTDSGPSAFAKAPLSGLYARPEAVRRTTSTTHEVRGPETRPRAAAAAAPASSRAKRSR